MERLLLMVMIMEWKCFLKTLRAGEGMTIMFITFSCWLSFSPHHQHYHSFFSCFLIVFAFYLPSIPIESRVWNGRKVCVVCYHQSHDLDTKINSLTFEFTHSFSYTFRLNAWMQLRKHEGSLLFDYIWSQKLFSLLSCLSPLEIFVSFRSTFRCWVLLFNTDQGKEKRLNPRRGV